MLAYAVLLVAAAAFAYVKEMETVWKINYVCGFLQILLMLVFHNKCEANRFVKMNRDTANLPAGQMIRVNRMMMGIYTILGLAVMGIFSFLPFNRLFSAIGQGLLLSLIHILGRIFTDSGEFLVEDTIHLLGGKVGHVGRMTRGMLQAGEKVTPVSYTHLRTGCRSR